jgi:signal transduction histidine kinase
LYEAILNSGTEINNPIKKSNTVPRNKVRDFKAENKIMESGGTNKRSHERDVDQVKSDLINEKLIKSGDKAEKHIIGRFIETEETTRKQFASDLYDDLGPILSTINMQLGLLNLHITQPQHLDIINHCKELLKESIEKMRDIADRISYKTG